MVVSESFYQLFEVYRASETSVTVSCHIVLAGFHVVTSGVPDVVITVSYPLA